MNVHILQHAAFEGPGQIQVWLEANGHTATIVRLYAGDALPEIEDVNALVILGGPMSVHDEHCCDWLHPEKVFIEDCIRDARPVLGICLGAQLIATCLGAMVYTAANREIGWFPVTPTDECRTAGWFQELLRDAPAVLHWHGEKFDIPYDGSLDLLRSEANDHQAFMRGDRVIGLQFHLEATVSGLDAMIANDPLPEPAGPFVQDEAALRAGVVHLPENHGILGGLLERWLGTAAAR